MFINSLKSLLGILLTLIVCSCDPNQIYETNHDFKKQIWSADSTRKFDFHINDQTKRYNIYFNIRNTSKYPYQNIFFHYSLTDSLHNSLKQELIDKLLFNPQTGKPLGNSGIGDIYSHQFILLEGFAFPYPGDYELEFKQMMRLDTLNDVVSIGARVEIVQEN